MRVLVAVDSIQALGGAPVRILAEIIAGSASRQIIARAKHWGANLIVLGTNERRGLSRLLFGSTIRSKEIHLSLETAASAGGLQASRKAA
jgi:nucleotide-binding universal stress UspA family protein